MTPEQQQQYCNVAKKILHEAIMSVNLKAVENEMDVNVLFWYFSTFVDERADKVWDNVQAALLKVNS